MIIDVICYNGEKELFEIRYNILKDYVDEFIVVEFDKTFSGKPKKKLFDFDLPKVKYFYHTEKLYNKYMDLAISSPNTQGAEHWKREFCQKESIKDAISHLKDEDIVFIGDCDEIWESNLVYEHRYVPFKLKLRVYTYYLNNRSSEVFYGTLVSPYVCIKDECLNYLRTNSNKIEHVSGWHFTSMGGYEEVKRKLSDSYTRESYWTEGVENNLKDNVEKSLDFLGRGFTYIEDETELPQYLLDNKEKYKKLWRK